MRVEQVVVGDVRGLAEHEQRRYPDVLEGRRLPRHLAVRGDDGALAVAVAEPAVVVGQQVDGELPGDELARRRRQHALLVAAVDPLLERDIRAVAARVLGGRDAELGRQQDRRIEQHEPLDAVRRRSSRLVGDASAERVAEPGSRAWRRGVEDVGDVLLEVPRRLPRRARVPAQVERDDVEAVGQALCQLLEVPAVTGDAVQTDERRQARVAPLVAGEAQEGEEASGPVTSSSRRVSASLTRLQTTTPSLSIRNVPRTAAPVDSSKTP